MFLSHLFAMSVQNNLSRLECQQIKKHYFIIWMEFYALTCQIKKTFTAWLFFSIANYQVQPLFKTGNDLLCKVNNPLKRLFGHEKNRQSADYRSRYRFFLRSEQNFDKFWIFLSKRTLWHCNSMFGRLPIFFMTKQSF